MSFLLLRYNFSTHGSWLKASSGSSTFPEKKENACRSSSSLHIHPLLRRLSQRGKEPSDVWTSAQRWTKVSPRTHLILLQSSSHTFPDQQVFVINSNNLDGKCPQITTPSFFFSCFDYYLIFSTYYTFKITRCHTFVTKQCVLSFSILCLSHVNYWLVQSVVIRFIFTHNFIFIDVSL